MKKHHDIENGNQNKSHINEPDSHKPQDENTFGPDEPEEKSSRFGPKNTIPADDYQRSQVNRPARVAPGAQKDPAASQEETEINTSKEAETNSPNRKQAGYPADAESNSPNHDKSNSAGHGESNSPDRGKSNSADDANFDSPEFHEAPLENDSEMTDKSSPADAESGQELIDQLKYELEQARDSMLRKAAEFENLKKRTQREKARLYEEARVFAVSRFLPVRENLQRSVNAANDIKIDKGLQSGLQMVMDSFDRVLDQCGLVPIEETGIPFDVDLHDAMLTQPPPDETTETNTVLQVLEPGYKIGDRVIRHAKVIVSQ